MNKESLEQIIKNFDTLEKVKFIYNGLEVSSRFDNVSKPFEDTSYKSLLSYNLYSITINAIILKGLGKIRGKNLAKSFNTFFNKIIKTSKNEILSNTKVQVEKAENILDAFLFDREKITLSMMLSTFLPLVVINLINNHKSDDKKIIKLYESNKEIILNQATLYVRSAYHSLLNIEDIDQTLLSFDKGDILNGILFYDDMIIFTTYKDCCTFDGFKRVISDDVNYLTDENKLENISKVALLYLTRDTIIYFDL